MNRESWLVDIGVINPAMMLHDCLISSASGFDGVFMLLGTFPVLYIQFHQDMNGMLTNPL